MAGRSSRFPKSERLLSRADFDRVQNGTDVRRASSTHFLVLLAARSVDGKGPRLGIIASRRVGSSVRRNRAKRLIREFFRTSKPAGLGDDDMVVVVKTGAETLSAAKAAEELAATTARAVKARPEKVTRPPRSKAKPAKAAKTTKGAP